MPRLENWEKLPNSMGYTLRGEIYADEKKRFDDGTCVRTSRVQSMNSTETEAKTLNTTYQLGVPSMSPHGPGSPMATPVSELSNEALLAEHSSALFFENASDDILQVNRASARVISCEAEIARRGISFEE